MRKIMHAHMGAYFHDPWLKLITTLQAYCKIVSKYTREKIRHDTRFLKWAEKKLKTENISITLHVF